MSAKNYSGKFFAAVIVCVLLTFASGFAHGWLDGRWDDSPDLERIGSALTDLPPVIGDWKFVEDRQLTPNAARQLRCHGYTQKVYQHQTTGEKINFAILFGPRGPIAVHTPEICYSGKGLKEDGVRKKEVIQSGEMEHSLWKVSFQTKTEGKPSTEVYYAWSTGGQWQAAEHPRVWFTKNLYKIQLAGPPPAENEKSQTREFLQQLLKHVQPNLSEGI